MRDTAACNISYDCLLYLDIKKINAYIEGFNLQRQTKVNDMLNVLYINDIKQSQAIWGDKGFKNKPEPIIIVEDKDDAVNRLNNKVINALKAKGMNIG